MTFTELDKRLIHSALQRLAGGNLGRILELMIQFCELTDAQQETQLRGEAAAVYNETLESITALDAEKVRLQDQAAILLARSQGQ